MAAVNADLAKVGTYLHGRRTYLTMAVWEADAAWARAVAGVCGVRGWTCVAGGGQGRVLLDAGVGAHAAHPVGTAGRRRGLVALRCDRRFSNGVVQATYDVIRHEQS